MIEKNLYKDRSYSSCIHSAYELMFTNLQQYSVKHG